MKIPDTLYTMRPGSNAQVTIMSKLDKDLDALETYTIVEDHMKPGDVTCSCPSRMQPCKHVKLLRHAKAASDDYQSLYWWVAPKAVEIKSFTASDVGVA